jgi:L-2-hydroxyglutarate oxidase
MTQASSWDAIIVGGGIIGAAVAYKIQQRDPSAKVLVLEKESKPASHQTGRNSGVIHSGLYYKPGSMKARTCLDGYHQLLKFCQLHELPYDICGKLVAATNDQEVDRLHALKERGQTNGLTHLTILSGEEAMEMEPELACLAALHVPQTGIVNYVKVTQAMLKGSEVITNCKVKGLKRHQGVTTVSSNIGKHQAPRVIVCAGLQSDRLAAMDGLDARMRIVPFRGDYFELKPQAIAKVKHLIYPVPDPQFPFLGVHFTRMIEGGVECGPNAVFSMAREGYGKLDLHPKDLLDALSWRGTLELFARHWNDGLKEMHRALSKAAFLKALNRLIPSLTGSDIQALRSGIRAQAVDIKGQLVDDFVLKQGAAAFHVLNAPSPAATSSLAIADEILNQAWPK